MPDTGLFWKLPRVDGRMASARYRVGIPGMFLEARGIQSRLFDDRDTPILTPAPLALVFAKAFTSQDVALAAHAKALGIPVVLDLCDNIFVGGYRTDRADPGAFVDMTFLAAAVVVTGPAMVKVVRAATRAPVPIHIIDDGAETYELSQQVVRWMVRRHLKDRVWLLWEHLQRGRSCASRGVLPSSLRNVVVAALIHGWTTGLSLALQVLPVSMHPPVVRAATSVECAIRWGIGLQRRMRAYLKKRLTHILNSWQSGGTEWLSDAISRRWHGTSNAAEEREAQAVATDASSAIPLPEARPAYEMRSARPHAKLRAGGKRLIWFGNAGAAYSSFGLRELVSLTESIVHVAQRIELEVIIISNNEALYRQLIKPLPYASRYFEWNPAVVRQCLARADVALIPNLLDPFSICKSPNRTVSALVAGVPVVATRTPSLEPFESCVIFDDWSGGIERYLVDRTLVAEHLARASALIERRYAGPRIAEQWGRVIHGLNAMVSPTEAAP